jgi:uncharacterized protein YgbK (DUF1537 family)
VTEAEAEAIGIVADDPTGAADCGVAFAESGRRTVVAFDGLTRDASVLIRSTDSRHLPDALAADQAAAAARELSAAGWPVRYKKIDSMLRGPVAAETRAVMQEARRPVGLVAPSFPQLGRRVRAGRLIATSVEGEHDQGHVGEPFGPAAVLIPLATVRSGPDAVLDQAERMRDRGGGMVVADAETDDDLGILATVAERAAGWLLPVGSGGYAAALARRHPGSTTIAPTDLDNGPVLVVSASAAPATTSQLDRLAQRSDVVHIALEPATSPRLMERIARRVEVALARGDDVILRVTPIYRDGELSRAGASTIGRIAGRVLESTRPAGLVVCGGDTLTEVASAVGSPSFDVVGAIILGVVLGRLSGGSQRGLPIITKAGGWGNADAIVRTLQLARSAPGFPSEGGE